MATKAAPRPETAAEKMAARQAYEGYLEEAMREPVKFVKHDARAHDDEKLYRLVNKNGIEWYGWYWLLVELLTGRKDHSYDVSDDAGWRRLAIDMSCMCDMDVDFCKLFVMELAHFGLISQEQLSERQHVVITRVRMDATAYAESVASKKLGAWKANQRKMFG